jgi:hypothetical protein
MALSEPGPVRSRGSTHRWPERRARAHRDRGERPQAIPLAEHGIWGCPHHGGEQHRQGVGAFK